MSSLKKTQIFTPEWVTKDLLDMLDQDNFKNPNTYFFEPSCGDGQMLKVIVERIYKALFEKHKLKEKALAETLFKFYAVELDAELVVAARERLFLFLKEKIQDKDFNFELFSDFMIANALVDFIENRDFFDVMKKDIGSKKKTGTSSEK